MQFITHTVFFQALGYAIANSLWQMAFLWFLYLIVANILKLSAAYRCRLGMGLQITGFVWFVVTLLFYYQQCTDTLSNAYSLPIGKEYQLILPTLDNSTVSGFVAVMIRAEQALPFLSFGYLIVLVVLIVQWVHSYNYAQRIKHNGLHKIDVHWKLFTKEIAQRLGIKQNVRIYLSDLISTPMTIGFLKPIVLVPLASLNNLTAAQMEAVLLHELAHIKRFDYLLNILLSAMEMVLFFNPFTLLLSKQIKKERENSCDDWVLQFQYCPAIYAEALLQIANMQTNAAFAMALVKNNKKDLLHRVKRMAGYQEKKFNYRYQLLTLLMLSTILFSIAWLQPMSKTQQLTQISKKKTDTKQLQQVLVEPMAAKVSNPLFNPIFFLQGPLKKEIAKAIDMASDVVRENPDIAEQALKKVAAVVPIVSKSLDNINWQETEANISNGLETAYNEINNMYEHKQLTSDSLVKQKQALVVNDFGKLQKNLSEALAQWKEYGLASLTNQANNGNLTKQLKKWEEDLHKVLDQLATTSTQTSEEKQVNRKIKNNIQSLQKLTYAKNRMLQNKNKINLDSLKDALSYFESSYAYSPVQYNLADAYVVGHPTNLYSVQAQNATASSIQINTSIDTTFSLVGKSHQKSKRYEIIVKNKSGLEKKLTVIVED
jgi:beta-lactamase regulating signal transducer with metallopeptidase domain